MSFDDAEQRSESAPEGPNARLLRSFDEESVDVDVNVPFPLFADAHRRDPNVPAPRPALDPVDVVEPVLGSIEHSTTPNHPVLYLDDTEGGPS